MKTMSAICRQDSRIKKYSISHDISNINLIISSITSLINLFLPVVCDPLLQTDLSYHYSSISNNRKQLIFQHNIILNSLIFR